MSNLPREQLDDISVQRFQENVARQNNKLQKTNTASFDTINKQTSDLQTQINNLPAIPNLGFTKGELHSVVLSAGYNASYVFSHTLGVTPKAWWIADVGTNGHTGTVTTFDTIPCRIAWSNSDLNIHFDLTSQTHDAFVTIYVVA